MLVNSKKALTFYLCQRYFSFLLKYHKTDVEVIASASDYLIAPDQLKDASNAIQRELYRTARELGWRKVGGRKWERSEILVDFTD